MSDAQSPTESGGADAPDDYDGLFGSPKQPPWYEFGWQDISFGPSTKSSLYNEPSLGDSYGPSQKLTGPSSYSADHVIQFEIEGWWYNSADHDESCRISVLHRHDFDGGIKFKNSDDFQKQLSTAEFRVFQWTARMTNAMDMAGSSELTDRGNWSMNGLDSSRAMRSPRFGLAATGGSAPVANTTLTGATGFAPVNGQSAMANINTHAAPSASQESIAGIGRSELDMDFDQGMLPVVGATGPQLAKGSQTRAGVHKKANAALRNTPAAGSGGRPDQAIQQNTKRPVSHA